MKLYRLANHIKTMKALRLFVRGAFCIGGWCFWGFGDRIGDREAGMGFEIEEYYERRSCWQEFLSNRRNDAVRCCYS